MYSVCLKRQLESVILSAKQCFAVHPSLYALPYFIANKYDHGHKVAVNMHLAFA